MKRLKIAASYEKTWLEIDRPQPLSDNRLEMAQLDIINGNMDKDVSDMVYDNFKTECEAWLTSSTLNTLSGLNEFSRKDIIIGCTQYIDSLYMAHDVQVIQGDYRYHERLGNTYSMPGQLLANVPLIIALPFPSRGDIHPDMDAILDECVEKNIPVHIDGAWITCCRNITFDFSHPAIASVAISLSKGLGLGWNRVGLRWTNQSPADAISIMNDFHMNNRALVIIGLHFIRKFPIDYLWNTHRERYEKVCTDFELTPTNSIYLAMNGGDATGVSPLIRYLENHEMVVNVKEVDGVEIPFDASWRNIAISLSGGADSALLAYMLCSLISDNTVVHVISHIRMWKTRPWQSHNSLSVFTWLTAKFPTLIFVRHTNFIAPDVEYGNMGPTIKDEYGKMVSGDNAQQRAYAEYIGHRHEIDAYYNAVTRNPRNVTFAGMSERDIELSPMNAHLQVMRHMGRWALHPFRFVDKAWVIKQYARLDILALLEITRSCEGEFEGIDFNTYVIGDPVPECGVCFWCNERRWAIEQNQ